MNSQTNPNLFYSPQPYAEFWFHLQFLAYMKNHNLPNETHHHNYITSLGPV